jgi:hypothetical protein
MGRQEICAKTSSRDLRLLLIPHEAECRSEGHSDSDSETDIIDGHTHGDTESEADANTKRNSLPRWF